MYPYGMIAGDQTVTNCGSGDTVIYGATTPFKFYGYAYGSFNKFIVSIKVHGFSLLRKKNGTLLHVN
jgi:hypothetical protein